MCSLLENGDSVGYRNWKIPKYIGLVSSILTQKMEKEKNILMTKQIAFGAWETTQEDTLIGDNFNILFM